MEGFTMFFTALPRNTLNDGFGTPCFGYPQKVLRCKHILELFFVNMFARGWKSIFTLMCIQLPSNNYWFKRLGRPGYHEMYWEMDSS